MGRYQADTFRCSRLINNPQLTAACAVAEQIWVTSFLISCAKRLWDAVGHFLGCRKPPEKPRFNRVSWLLDRPKEYLNTWPLKC